MMKSETKMGQCRPFHLQILNPLSCSRNQVTERNDIDSKMFGEQLMRVQTLIAFFPPSVLLPTLQRAGPELQNAECRVS